MSSTVLAASSVDYLYVEANEGDSSGGHVALRFGNETFHFQHENPGILRVRRFESAAFVHYYALLGNRTIHESRIAVSAETYSLLRDSFSRLLLVQDAQLEFRDALHRDAALFEQLFKGVHARTRASEDIIMPLKGVGYFLTDGARSNEALGANKAETAARSVALVSLREHVAAVHGNHFIAEQYKRARTIVREMDLLAEKPSVPVTSPDAYPVSTSSVSDRLENALLALYALRVLHDTPPLLPGAFWTSDIDAFRLDPQESLVLKEFSRRLESDLVRLVASSREDWALPFFIGMARLAAAEASIATGRLVFLDIFPDDAYVPEDLNAALRPFFRSLEMEKLEIFQRRRLDFFTKGNPIEAEYAVLERAGNLFLDIRRAIVTGKALRRDADTPFPSRVSWQSFPVPGKLERSDLLVELTAIRAAERDYNAALHRLYSYDLIRRNCVTEIFSMINHVVEPHSPAPGHGENMPAGIPPHFTRNESVKRLGGYIDASRGFVFIPFVSAREVEASYAVIASREIPSYRTERIAEMEHRESPLRVFLRESNTLTSTIYLPGPEDSKFLFFTDQIPILRPLFGLFNLLVGTGECVLGMATLPLEGPDRLISGAKGVLFSIPELVFVNLRKGSMVYVEKNAVPNTTEEKVVDIGAPSFPVGEEIHIISAMPRLFEVMP